MTGSHLQRPHALPAALGASRIMVILLREGHGGGAVGLGDRGVGPALQQRPHDLPTAVVAGHPQRRLTPVTTVVDAGLGAGMAEQHAHTSR
jgi:hypothetical protein